MKHPGWTFDDYERAGLCECGAKLQGHVDAPKLPWGRVSIQADLGRSTWRTFTPKRKR